MSYPARAEGLVNSTFTPRAPLIICAVIWYSVFLSNINFFHNLPKTLTGTTTSVQTGPESNRIEGVLHTPQRLRTGGSPSDAI